VFSERFHIYSSCRLYRTAPFNRCGTYTALVVCTGRTIESMQYIYCSCRFYRKAPLNPCSTYTALDVCTGRHHLNTKLYNKRDEFNFLTVNFPFISSNIPSAPAHGVYISQSIRYSRACCQHSDFLNRAELLTQKLLKHGNIVPM
jgi:hypothetical protein